MNQLTEDELRGLQAYYSDRVILFERGKFCAVSTSPVAMISAVASLITGMIIYIGSVIDNAIAVMATQVKSTEEQKIIFDIVADTIDCAEGGGTFFAIVVFFELVINIPIAIAFLPGIATTLHGQYKEMGSLETINIFVAFIFSVPFLLEVVLTVFNIIENDKVQRTPSAAKELQDKIVTELAYGYLG